ncbi:MAG: hypothetical protein AAF329_26995, partial [Cyanobacteria bacterium P01_A01_bin.17]
IMGNRPPVFLQGVFSGIVINVSRWHVLISIDLPNQTAVPGRDWQSISSILVFPQHPWIACSTVSTSAVFLSDNASDCIWSASAIPARSLVTK